MWKNWRWWYVLRRSAACPLMIDESNSGFTYSWAGGVGEGLIAARRCLIGRLLSMLAFLLGSVHSRVLELLSYAFVSWPPFDPVWCERLPGFMVNTSLSQLSFQLVLVAPALSRSPLLSSPKKTKNTALGVLVNMAYEDTAPELVQKEKKKTTARLCYKTNSSSF